MLRVNSRCFYLSIIYLCTIFNLIFAVLLLMRDQTDRNQLGKPLAVVNFVMAVVMTLAQAPVIVYCFTGKLLMIVLGLVANLVYIMLRMFLPRHAHLEYNVSVFVFIFVAYHYIRHCLLESKQVGLGNKLLASQISIVSKNVSRKKPVPRKNSTKLIPKIVKPN